MKHKEDETCTVGYRNLHIVLIIIIAVPCTFIEKKIWRKYKTFVNKDILDLLYQEGYCLVRQKASLLILFDQDQKLLLLPQREVWE